MQIFWTINIAGMYKKVVKDDKALEVVGLRIGSP